MATSVFTLAELADLAERRKGVLPPAYAHFIQARGPILAPSPRAALAAGATKWRQRSRGRPLGLADAIIYETARENGLDVVTGDEGFRGLDGVEFLGPRRA